MKPPPITSPDDPRLTDKVKARFWAKVQKAGPDECWLWTAARNHLGYGSFVVATGLKCGAHRLSLILNGQSPTPEVPMACHHCHTPGCVNPGHLYWGTAKTNADDARRAGRLIGMGDAARVAAFLSSRPRGEQNRNSKLTAEDVQQIREEIEKGVLHAEIAKRFQVTRPTIGLIARNVTWRTESAPQRRCREIRTGRRIGQAHPMARLKEQDVVAIREAYRMGATQEQIAEGYGIAQVTVSAIVRGRRWKHLLTQENGIQSGNP